MKKSLWVMTFVSLLVSAEGFEPFENMGTDGELRFGAVQLKNLEGKNTSTIALGGHLSLETQPIKGISAGVSFYTTNALFGKNTEVMFLGSENQSYSIVGEAYIQADVSDTNIKVGRQIIETPFINSDDIGIVPDIVEGYSLTNQSLPETSIVLGAFDKWSGIDSPKPEKFSKMQNSGDFVLMSGLIYEGIRNTTLQAWNYKIDNNNWSYLEGNYEKENFSLAGQYSHQGEGNNLYGFNTVVNFNRLSLHTAYNKANGVVSNGFGGGPFFTSSEDHTIHETLNNEAILMGVEYNLDNLRVALTHVNFSEIEDETDYIVAYEFNNKLSAEFIYSHMYHDGRLTRFFINQSF